VAGVVSAAGACHGSSWCCGGAAPLEGGAPLAAAVAAAETGPLPEGATAVGCLVVVCLISKSGCMGIICLLTGVSAAIGPARPLGYLRVTPTVPQQLWYPTTNDAR